MKRTVVYGLGKLYHRYRRMIERREGIAAHCDRNPEAIAGFKDGITAETLAKTIDSYDEVYVTASMLSVLPYLRDILHIPMPKIVYFRSELPSYGGVHPEINFYVPSGEDAVLDGLFQRLGLLLSRVKYLEIGTNDPISGNNSYFLYRAGARGVLVDPMPVVADAVGIYRPGDRLIRAAVTGRAASKEATFYISNTLGSSSLHEEFQKEFVGQNRSVVDSYTVPLVGVNELLEEIGFLPDFMQVDAEGEDETIVRAIDFRKYRPKVLMVEIDHCDEESMIGFMQENGYAWYTSVGAVNAIFVEKGLLPSTAP